ncbi:hypothetical protein GCM10023194_47660 [Planotetraspora phitsanulokensis]|uniref:hypothetical protein n=1 Tax=Planotetraspora phitsanulokensis TaxID=575192 RepID=UPI0031ECEB59
MELSADGRQVGMLDEVAMLVGMAPFTGIDVGIDRRGPVSWPVHERHGAFPFTGILHHVRYSPGQLADYAPEAVLRATERATRIYE